MKDHQLISEKDARMVSLPIIEKTQFIAKYGTIYSIKIRLQRDIHPNDGLMPIFLN